MLSVFLKEASFCKNVFYVTAFIYVSKAATILVGDLLPDKAQW